MDFSQIYVFAIFYFTDFLAVVSREDVMARIPFMMPGNNAHTFKEFIEKVKKVVEGKGLTHREILGKIIFSSILALFFKQCHMMLASNLRLNNTLLLTVH